jgi:hypothetical protein
VKLAPERPFSVNGTYSLAELDAILAAVEKDPDLAVVADNIAQGLVGRSAAGVHRAVAQGQNPTGIPGGPLYHLSERGDPHELQAHAARDGEQLRLDAPFQENILRPIHCGSPGDLQEKTENHSIAAEYLE